MSRHSSSIPLTLDKEIEMSIGGQTVILTCSGADCLSDPNKAIVTEMYVDKSTGKLVIVYDDGV